MAEGESAEKHLLGMNELCDRLAAMELLVPEEFQPLMILASLPASYTGIVQTLGSQARKLDMMHERLERQYEKRTASSKLSLVQRYFGAKMAEGESAEKHLLGMNELCDRLAAMELLVPEEFQPLMILASLPASYTGIVQTLGSQAGKLDMMHVTNTVLDEDARRRENGSLENQALVSHGEDNRGIPPGKTFHVSSATTARRWDTSVMNVPIHQSSITRQH